MELNSARHRSRGFLTVVIFLLLHVTYTGSVTVPGDENIAAVVRFTNSLVPPLFQTFSANYTNLVMAPFGLSTSLAITMDCVHGESFNEIIKLFKLQSKPARQQLRTGFKTILHDFKQATSNDELAGSYNKAFLTSSKMFPTPFIEQLSNTYLVDVTNNSSLTRNFTTAQILELRTDTGIMSHWRDYQKLVVFTYLSYSSSEPFYSHMNKTINVPMIPLIGYFKAGYLPKLESNGAELLFENTKVSLLVLMPDKIDGLNDLQTKLFQENFFEVLDSLPQQETQILIPQLSTVSNNLEFTSMLKSLGVVSAFSSNLNDKKKRDVFIQSIKQNAFFSTSFTALNSIGSFITKYDGKNSSDIQARKKREAKTKIVFNKPFMFFLIHRESGLILLTGHITQPKLLPN
ncbi:serpin B13-like [Planococcus citri]|uniref:serpin B13-like n=1 Tax=Planococcus citri TaxID=170843 RepID=UPI0031F7E0D4